jgi:predicted transposase YdaD
MFKLHDLRKTRVWQDAFEEGRQEGRIIANQQFFSYLKANGLSPKEIAQLLGISLSEVRSLSKRKVKDT